MIAFGFAMTEREGLGDPPNQEFVWRRSRSEILRLRARLDLRQLNLLLRPGRGLELKDLVLLHQMPIVDPDSAKQEKVTARPGGGGDRLRGGDEHARRRPGGGMVTWASFSPRTPRSWEEQIPALSWKRSRIPPSATTREDQW